MQNKYSIHDLDELLSSNYINDVMINFEQLIQLINIGKFVLTTECGKRLTITNHPNVSIPPDRFFVDSGDCNYGENTFEIVLSGQ